MRNDARRARRVANAVLASLLLGGVASLVSAGPAAATPTAQTFSAIVLSPRPIAPAGSLVSSSSTPVTVTALDNTGAPVAGARIGVYLQGPSAAVPSGSAQVKCSGTTTATSVSATTTAPTPCTTSADGTVAVTYIAAPIAPTSPRKDTLTACQLSGTTCVAPTSTTTYLYAPVAGYVFSSNPIAPPGSLDATGGQVTITVTAVNAAGGPVPNAVMYVAKSTGFLGTLGPACTSATPPACTADSTGKVNLQYTAKSPSLQSTGATDRVTVKNAASGETVTATDAYTYLAAANHYVFNPWPIAPGGAGSLGATHSPMALRVTSSGTPYLTATTTPGTFYLRTGSPPIECTLFDATQVQIKEASDYPYMAASTTHDAPPRWAAGNLICYNPAQNVTSGTDLITASDTNPSCVAPGSGSATCASVPLAGNPPAQESTNGYSYAAPTGYSFDKVGAIDAKSGEVVPLTLTTGVTTGVPFDKVAITLARAGGGAPWGVATSGPLAEAPTGGPATGGSETTPPAAGYGPQCGVSPFTEASLSPTAVTCYADANGTIDLTYLAPSILPSSGTDVIVATCASCSGATRPSAQFSYTFGTVSYVFDKVPIGTAGGLWTSAATPVNLIVKNASGAPVPNVVVRLGTQRPGSTPAGASKVPAPYCGTAEKTLSNTTLADCMTDALGTIPISFTPGTTAGTGYPVDLIVARDTGSTAPPTVMASTAYVYKPVVSYRMTPTPIAANGSLPASRPVTISVTALDAAGAPVASAPVALTFARATGGGTASAPASQCGPDTSGTTTLSGLAADCVTDANGAIVVQYSTPASLPSSGTDTLIAATDTTASPSAKATDTYVYNALATYTFSPSPIAAAGSLQPGASVPVTLAAKRADGSAIANAPVFLSLSPDIDAGTASVTQCGAVSKLSAAPAACTADSSGTVVITYTAPAGGTKAGTATLTAQNASTKAESTTTAADSYTLLDDFGVVRLAGTDRYDTAAAIARAAFPSGTVTAVLTTGTNFPDALAGAFLAGTEQGGAPVLLTDPDALSAPTATALRDLHAVNVVILGGSAAVSDAVASELTATGYNVTRVAGETRYDTMQQLIDQRAESVAMVDGKKTAILATGANFPDALGAGPLAYGNGLPIVLTDGKQPMLVQQARDALTNAQIAQVVIVGGSGAIDPGINADLQAMGITILEQAAGVDRSATSAALATWAVGHGLASAEDIGIANGCRPGAGTSVVPCFTPDALSGAPFGGSQPSPVPTLITLSPTDPGSVTEYARTNSSTLQVGHVYGGTDAVADSMLQTIATAAGP